MSVSVVDATLNENRLATGRFHHMLRVHCCAAVRQLSAPFEGTAQSTHPVLFHGSTQVVCQVIVSLLGSWQRTALRNPVRFDDFSGLNGIDIHQLARFLGGEKLNAAAETCSLWHNKAD